MQSSVVSLVKFMIAVTIGIMIRTIYELPGISKLESGLPLFYDPRPDSDELARVILGSKHIRTQLRESFRPVSASEVIPYDFFNASMLISAGSTVPSTVLALRRVDRLDIADLILQAAALLGSNSVEIHRRRITRLESGYRRLDPVRGVEYVLNVMTTSVRTRSNERRQLRLVRPFGAVQLLSDKPNRHTNVLHMIVAVPGATEPFGLFLKNFEDIFHASSDQDDGSSSVFLVIVVCSRSLSEANSVRTAVSDFQSRHRHSAHIRVVHTHHKFSEPYCLDLGTRQLPGSAHLMFSHVGVTFTKETLDRCRFGAIESQRVYYPVPFGLYHPEIVRQYSPQDREGSSLAPVGNLTGEWLFDDYRQSCMYASDYRLVGGFDVAVDNWHFSMYQKHVTLATNLQVLRAADPGLVLNHRATSCNKTERAKTNCPTNFASRDQLAYLLLDKLPNFFGDK